CRGLRTRTREKPWSAAHVVNAIKYFPQIGTFTMLELPTGSYAKGLGIGKAWYKAPLWLQKNFGPWLLDGGGGETFVPQAGYRNFAYGGLLAKYTLNQRLELAGEVFAHGAEGAAALPDRRVGDAGYRRLLPLQEPGPSGSFLLRTQRCRPERELPLFGDVSDLGQGPSRGRRAARRDACRTCPGAARAAWKVGCRLGSGKMLGGVAPERIEHGAAAVFAPRLEIFREQVISFAATGGSQDEAVPIADLGVVAPAPGIVYQAQAGFHGLPQCELAHQSARQPCRNVQFAGGVGVILVQHLPAQAAGALRPQTGKPLLRARLLERIGGIVPVKQQVGVGEIGGRAGAHGRRSCAWSRVQRLETSTPGAGDSFFQRSKACQYSSLSRICCSSMRPTRREMEVSSSAALRRAQCAASSEMRTVMFLATGSV